MRKTFAIVAVIVIAAALLVPKLKNTSVSKLPLEDKMNWAESYLQDLKKEGNAFFATMQKSINVANEVKEFNKILEKYTDRMNSLHLPCPTSNQTRNDTRLRSYLSWAKDFEARNKKLMATFQQQLNQLQNSGL